MDPYDPQRPSPPESFAGRARLVEQATAFLARARLQRTSAALLIHGHRGSGKTSALRKIEALAVEASPDALAIEIPLRQTSTEGALLRALVEEVSSHARRRRAEGNKWAKALERLASVSVDVMGSGVSVERAAPSRDRNSLTLWSECLDALPRDTILTACIDDAEHLDEAGVGTLKTIAEARTPVPILLAVSAGPELMRRLATPEFSPVARAFSGATFDMEAFTPSETREALDAALKAPHATGRWHGEAARRIHELSHGYPYLVKCIASAAYRDVATMTEEDVNRAVPRALEIASPWLEREIPRASDGDIKAFVKIAKSERTSLKSSEIIELGINSAYIGRLLHLDVLKNVAPGHYELRKAPVVAYYHELKRRRG